MPSKYLNKFKFPFYFKIQKGHFALKSILKGRRKRRKIASMEESLEETLEYCAPYCPYASFLEESEMCRYSGMLKCSKYNELVPKYAPCLDKKRNKKG